MAFCGSPDIAHGAAVPPRSTQLDTGALWAQTTQVASTVRGVTQLAARGPAPRPGEVVVGIKRPGHARGVWRDRILIDRRSLDRSERVLLGVPGVHLLDRSSDLPQLAVRVDSRAVLARIRTLSFVDYIDPLYFPDVEASSPGCSVAAISGGPRVPEGDVLSWTYDAQQIRQAWARDPAAGHGITVGVLDVGAVKSQGQITPAEFTGGRSGDRFVENLGSNRWWFQPPDTPWTTCDHGTRVAGLIAAPLDGRSTVGIAWRANLVTVNDSESIAVGPANEYWIARGLEKARAAGARIIEMAFGSPVYLNALADKIKYEYYRTDRPQPLFVGAIGSEICIGLKYFPAGRMNEVISVAGVAADGRTVVPSSCSGAKIGGIVGSDDSVPVPGGDRPWWLGPGPDPVETLGASSGGSATIAGILALIWSKYPWWTRDQVRDRLYSSSVPVNGGVELSAPNAYQAVGGFAFLGLRAPSQVRPGSRFTISAQPVGDGPFAYRWATGGTSSSITAAAGANGTVGSYAVTVTDLTDGTQRTAVAYVRFGSGVSPCAVPLLPQWPPKPPPCLPPSRATTITVSGAVSADGQWRAALRAWTTNLIVYKSIGATITVEHRELRCVLPLCIGGQKAWQWVARPARAITINNTYAPNPPPPGPCPPYSCPPPAPPRSCAAQNRSGLDCWDFAVMAGGAAQLNIKSVRAYGQADLPSGQTLRLGPVTSAFLF